MMKMGNFLLAAVLAIAFSLVFFGCSGEKKENKDANNANDGKNIEKDGKSGKNDKAAELPAKPGEDGLMEVLKMFVAPGADWAALSKGLRPTKADYEDAFNGDAAEKMEKAYAPEWDSGRPVVKPKSGQTEAIVYAAGTAEDMKSGNEKSKNFSGGFIDVAKAGHLKDGVTFYVIKFVKPGEKNGMTFHGFAHVNGRWVYFSKPWPVLK